MAKKFLAVVIFVQASLLWAVTAHECGEGASGRLELSVSCPGVGSSEAGSKQLCCDKQFSGADFAEVVCSPDGVVSCRYEGLDSEASSNAMDSATADSMIGRGNWSGDPGAVLEKRSLIDEWLAESLDGGKKGAGSAGDDGIGAGTTNNGVSDSVLDNLRPRAGVIDEVPELRNYFDRLKFSDH